MKALKERAVATWRALLLAGVVALMLAAYVLLIAAGYDKGESWNATLGCLG